MWYMSNPFYQTGRVQCISLLFFLTLDKTTFKNHFKKKTVLFVLPLFEEKYIGVSNHVKEQVLLNRIAYNHF